jgi:hypothetical protein
MTVLTLEDAATFLLLSPEELLSFARRRVVPGRKIGREWRFVLEVLEEYMVNPKANKRKKRKKKESRLSR